MRVREAAGIASILAFFALAVGMERADTLLGKNLCAAGAVALGIARARYGHHIQGWIGAPYHAIEAELTAIDRIAATWKYTDGSPIPANEVKKLMRRREKLYAQLREHPEHPKNGMDLAGAVVHGPPEVRRSSTEGAAKEHPRGQAAGAPTNETRPPSTQGRLSKALAVLGVLLLAAGAFYALTPKGEPEEPPGTAAWLDLEEPTIVTKPSEQVRRSLEVNEGGARARRQADREARGAGAAHK